jgi:sugar phosphate permease
MTANAIPLEQLDTDALEDSIYRKVSWRIVPLFICCFLFAYLDRVNISFAKLQMASDLGFSETVYGLGASLFFVGYFLFEVPSNVLLHKIGARIWIARLYFSSEIEFATLISLIFFSGARTDYSKKLYRSTNDSQTSER